MVNEIMFMGFPVKSEEIYECEYVYWIEIGNNKIYLDKNYETNEFSLCFSHSVVVCSKYNRMCDYEYHTCGGYEAGSIASRENIHGKYTYHCKHGTSKWLSNEEAQQKRPEKCQKIINLIKGGKICR